MTTFLLILDIMTDITTLNLENAVLKFNEIISHFYDHLISRIRLVLNSA